MASDLGLSPEEIAKASTDIANASADVNGELNTLYSRLETLRGVWQGQAAGAFNKTVEAMHREGDTIIRKLDELSNNIKVSGQDYVDAQERQAMEMSKIGNRLGG